MGWGLGFDANWNRWIGYGVPAWCDHPGCWEKIDRGLSYVCGDAPYGGEDGCGLYFCAQHRGAPHQRCARCRKYRRPFTPKGEHPEWVAHVATDASWTAWRADNPAQFRALAARATTPESPVVVAPPAGQESEP